MNRKHKYIFIFLCLFPFLLAMSFRAVDNYRIAMHKEQRKKAQPEYFPHEPPGDVVRYKLTCQKSKGISQSGTDSLTLDQPSTARPWTERIQ